MIVTELRPDPAAVEAATGWAFRPEGACKGAQCVPMGSDQPDVHELSQRLGMPLVRDEAHGLWALGPETASHTLATAEAPDVTLLDLAEQPVPLSRFRGRKVLLLAWASW